MASNWEEIYNRFLKGSKPALISIAKEQSEKMLGYFVKKGATREQAFQIFVAIYSTFVASDGQASDGEIEMFNKIFDLDLKDKEFMNLTKSGMSMVEKSKSFISRNDKEFKLMVINFGCAVCAYDGKMTTQERELIEYYSKA